MPPQKQIADENRPGCRRRVSTGPGTAERQTAGGDHVGYRCPRPGGLGDRPHHQGKDNGRTVLGRDVWQPRPGLQRRTQRGACHRSHRPAAGESARRGLRCPTRMAGHRGRHLPDRPATRRPDHHATTGRRIRPGIRPVLPASTLVAVGTARVPGALASPRTSPTPPMRPWSSSFSSSATCATARSAPASTWSRTTSEIWPEAPLKIGAPGAK